MRARLFTKECVNAPPTINPDFDPQVLQLGIDRNHVDSNHINRIGNSNHYSLKSNTALPASIENCFYPRSSAKISGKVFAALMLAIRNATAADVPLILDFIRGLAEYEREPKAVFATEDDLLRDGFRPDPISRCVIAEWVNTPTGFAS